MDSVKYLESLQNPSVKNWILLREKASERKAQGLFLVEGYKEISLALKGGYQAVAFIICKGFEKAPLPISESVQTFLVNLKIYEKLAYRVGTEGLLAVMKTKPHPLNTLKLSANPLILVAEAPEKPGNIGAMLRTADAAGVEAFIIANPKTDLYNSNLIRASLGAVFTTPIAMDSSENIIRFFQEKKIRSIAAVIHPDSEPYTTISYKGPCAIVVGTEADGLTSAWQTPNAQKALIAMHGQVDSMNVSVSAAILLFEAVRQRSIA